MLLVLLIAIFLLSLYQVKFKIRGFHDDYLSKSKTDSVKGIFILLIVLTHSMQYFAPCGYAYHSVGDTAFMWFTYHLSQLVVVMFLFYSGYGVSESFKKKGMPYVKAMPRHRLLTTLLNFDVAVLSFIILGFALGLSFTLKQCLLAFTGWVSVGNSNWYIFVILLCYLMTFISLRLDIKNPSLRVALVTALCAGCVLILSLYRQSWWFNTLLCYPAGFAFSTYKDSLEPSLKKYYWLFLSLMAIAFILLFSHANDRFGLSYNLLSIIFASLIVLLTMKCGIGNSVLEWFGKHLFPVYIYMRLPMMFMEHKTPALIASQPALFVLISLALTILIAHLYHFWQIKL